MPVFEYKALTEEGKTAAGILNADTPQEARVKLRAMRLLPTQVQEMDARQGAKGPGVPLARRLMRRNLSELALVTKQLATLLKSGIPLVEALTAIIEQIEDRAFEAVLRDVRDRIKNGSSFADALGEHPTYFNVLFVNMIRAGEASGNIDAVLSRLAEFTQRQNSLRNKVGAALAYPVILLFVAIGVVIFLMGKVVPTILGILSSRGAKLPFSTRTLIFVSGFVQHSWWILALGIVGMVFLFQGIRSTPAGRLWWDTFKLNIPLVGMLLKKQSIARFATTLSTLLSSGIPVVEALRITSTVVSNSRLTQTIENVANRIVEGADIATPLRQSRIFPPVVSYMIAVGEQSGQLEDVLKTVSQTYEEDVELTIQKFTSLLEPVMILTMASMVGFIVFAVLEPLLQMTSLAGGGK